MSVVCLLLLLLVGPQVFLFIPLQIAVAGDVRHSAADFHMLFIYVFFYIIQYKEKTVLLLFSYKALAGTL